MEIFLDIFPLQESDLPADRRAHGYDNLDFHFDGHGTVDDDLCVASRDLPDYKIAKIKTGQHLLGQVPIWEGRIRLVSD